MVALSDHWYDETACDLLFGVVVDEEPEPPARPVSQAVLDHLHPGLTNREPVALPSSGATEDHERRGGGPSTVAAARGPERESARPAPGA